MKLLVISSVALALASAPDAKAQGSFVRPDCSAYSAAIKPESKCIREIRKRWQDANFAALQKTGLMFIHMTRPDIETSPAARKAIEEKVEGSFTVRFSVALDGTVYNVKTVDVTDGLAPLASLWADTIGQWTFAKIDKPVTDIEYRRIYLYSAEDDAKSPQESQAAH
jgi:hypothetical protein